MSSATLCLDVQQVRQFFDEAPESSRRNASAIVGVMGEDLGIALLQRCLLERTGMKTEIVLKRNGVPWTPTRGTTKGRRLDRWLLQSDAPSNGKRNLYQVEVKNWSANSFGGKAIPCGSDSTFLENYRRRRWSVHWDDTQDCFRDQVAQKVLFRMSLPSIISSESVDVEPIICFWEALHPEGKQAALFECRRSTAKSDEFSKVWVFSMSEYLRSLKEPDIELEMTATAQRIEWLHRLFRLTCGHVGGATQAVGTG
jgi:hypothetical protein